MKPTIKVNGRVIIIICIVLLIILGILWLVNNNTNREGLASSKVEIFADDITSTIENEFNSAPIEINGGKTFADYKDSIPLLFDDLKAIYSSELASGLRDISYNTDTTTVIDTTKAPCHKEDNFLTGQKFGDSLTSNYQGKPRELNETCSELTSESCNLTDSCVWVNGKKCMAGNEDGPTEMVDMNGNDIDYAYYTHKGFCYGSCGKGANYANPCSEFKENDADVNIKCITRMWRQTGCPNARYVTSNVVKSLKAFSKGGIKALFATAKDEDNYEACYGPNQAEWPKPCDKFPKDSDTKLSIRCLTKLYNDTGCDNARGIIRRKFALDREFNTRGEMINEFNTYPYGINEDGKADTDYTKCYGADKINWPEPCHKTTDISTDLSQRCIKRLFRETNCTQAGVDYTITKDFVADNYANDKQTLKKLFKEIQYKNDDDSFMKCYGPDRNFWPARTMIIGIDRNFKLWFKYGRRVAKGPYIEDVPWEKDTASNQINMKSIAQIPNGWFYGTGQDERLYCKRYLNDKWERDKILHPGTRFRIVRMVMGILIGIGSAPHPQYKNGERLHWIDIIPQANGYFYNYATRPNVYFLGHDTDECIDIIATNVTPWPLAAIGTNNVVYLRGGYRKGRNVGWQNWNDIPLWQGGRIIAFINIPDGKKTATDGTPSGGTKVLGLGLGGLLYTQNRLYESWGWFGGVSIPNWDLVKNNNNIAMQNIAFVSINNNVPEFPILGYNSYLWNSSWDPGYRDRD